MDNNICFTNVGCFSTIQRKKAVYVCLCRLGSSCVDVQACYLFISTEPDAPLFPLYDMKSHINLSTFRDSTNLCSVENCRDAVLMNDFTTFRMHKLCLL